MAENNHKVICKNLNPFTEQFGTNSFLKKSKFYKELHRAFSQFFGDGCYFPLYNAPVNVNPVGGGGVRARGGDLRNFKIFPSNFPGWETKGQSKVSKKLPPQGKKSKQTMLYYYIKRIKEHFKHVVTTFIYG